MAATQCDSPPARAAELACAGSGSMPARRAFAWCWLAVLAALGLCGANAARADAGSWFEAGRPNAQAREAVELLSAAASHGLAPRDYEVDTLRQALAQAAQGAALAPDAVARAEQALSTAMQRYLAHLHHGRIDPRSIHPRFPPPQRDAFDAAASLRAALAAGRVADAVRAAQPPLAQYERLREALARYRGLLDHPAWRQALPALPGARKASLGELEPGQYYEGLALLAQRLVAVGDLAPDAPLPPRYTTPLVEAVTAFQQRHGLNPDGVIGRATWAALQVAPGARVRQIELALERLRWTPLLQAPRMIVINIPEFVLRAYEVQDGRIQVRQEMKVIVGKAMDARTPMILEPMRFIEFSPYWNVPPSIARNELVPRLRRDPGHFAQQGFEFVAADGRVGSVLSAAQLDAVLAGHSRIRQRPGPHNALGDIKFVFPNRDNIYLHHTPSTSLFGRERRDFSHGCIRVEAPVALAQFVLRPMPEWTEERIRAAMAQGTSATLRLAEPLPVLIAYGTSLVKNGRIHFFDDIYGHDRLLDAALQGRRPGRIPSPNRP
jgi:murein L,D-transpeptidase YcbB/YkuD